MADKRAILLVEDNEDDVVLVRRALRKGGIKSLLHIAYDGDEAVDYLSGSGQYQDGVLYPLPKIVLLDLRLPKRSGLEVLEWIKSHQHLKLLPVVVFTTSVQESDINQAYALGANSYLKKPYTMGDTTELLKAISTYWIEHNQRPLIERAPS